MSRSRVRRRTGLPARSRNVRIWTVALWALCLLAAAGGTAERAGQTDAGGAPPSAVGVLSAAADPAVLPARMTDEVRAATQAAPLRLLLVAAVIAVLVGLPPVLRRREPTPGEARQTLRARRYTVALRAPPLLFA